VLVVLWQLPYFLSGNSTLRPQFANAFRDVLFHHLWTLGAMLLLTAFSRTVSLRTVVAYWLFGVFAVYGLLVLVGTPIVAALGTETVAVYVAPFNQTVVQAAAVLLFYVLATRRRGTHPTVSDGLLVGLAIGAGVGFHEEMSYQRALSVGPGAEYAVGGTVWWSYLFPAIAWAGFFGSRNIGVTGTFNLYHPGWATLLGVGIGVAYVHRHDIRAWLVAAFAMSLSYLDHFATNYWAFNGQGAPLIGPIFTGGASEASQIGVYVFLGFVALGVAVDLVVLFRTGATYDSFPGFLAPVTSARSAEGAKRALAEMRARIGGTPRAVGRSLWAADRYARRRRAVLVGLYRAEQTGTVSSRLEPELRRLAVLQRRANARSPRGESTVETTGTRA
jgi:hypothetical protein